MEAYELTEVAGFRSESAPPRACGDLPRTRGVHPLRLAWFMAGFMGVIWRLLRLRREPPITDNTLRIVGQPFTVCTDKAKGELGYFPSVS